VDFVESIPGLTRREREMILSDNPAKLLKVRGGAGNTGAHVRTCRWKK
jgi:hypothetical protein